MPYLTTATRTYFNRFLLVYLLNISFSARSIVLSCLSSPTQCATITITDLLLALRMLTSTERWILEQALQSLFYVLGKADSSIKRTSCFTILYDRGIRSSASWLQQKSRSLNSLFSIIDKGRLLEVRRRTSRILKGLPLIVEYVLVINRRRSRGCYCLVAIDSSIKSQHFLVQFLQRVESVISCSLRRQSFQILVPLFRAYRQLQYRQRYLGAFVTTLKYCVLGLSLGIWLQTKYLRPRSFLVEGEVLELEGDSNRELSLSQINTSAVRRAPSCISTIISLN